MTVSRVKSWVSEVLTASDLNAEFNNVLNALNNSKIFAVDALTLATNDFLQYSGTAWANKTPTQALASLMTLGQIPFPAVQNASSNVNTLDDYEEGTFTPALTTGTSGTITLTTATGFYTKIGDRVFIHVYLLVASVSSPVGSLTLTSLPFTTANISGNNAAFSANYVGFAGVTNYMPFARVAVNDTLLTLQKIVANVPTNLAGDVQANSEIYIQGFMKVAT